jgi:cation diffusion facilitator CzcD-associated flavoprotein CzcO
LRFAIIGAGMSGILSAIKLLEAGDDDFAIYEKADRLGGTWRENTYPGIACDVPSHLYSPSFAPNPDWSHRSHPARRSDLSRRGAQRGRTDPLARVTRCEFPRRWQLETSAATGPGDVVIAPPGSSTTRASPTSRG